MAQLVRTGLFQFLKWDDYTTPKGYATTGVVDGGNLTIEPGTRKRIGISGAEVRKGGVITPAGSATFYITATNVDILTDYGLRASYPRGVLKPINFQGGLDEFYWTYTGALIGSFTIDWAVGEGIKSTIDWQSLNIKEETAPAVTVFNTETNEGFEDYEFAITFGGISYSVQSLSISVNNNVSVHSSGDDKTANTKRFPERLIYGAEELTVSLTTALPIPHSVLGTYIDCQPDNLGAVLTGTNACKDETLTITLTNLMQSDASSMGFVDHATAASFDYGFIGSSEAGSLAISYTV